MHDLFLSDCLHPAVEIKVQQETKISIILLGNRLRHNTGTKLVSTMTGTELWYKHLDGPQNNFKLGRVILWELLV